MIRVWLAVLALASCKDDRAAKAQQDFDRSVERAGGIERDKDGRAYNVATGKYLDHRGGSVAPAQAAPRGRLPPPPETDITRGRIAETLGNLAEAAALYQKACDEKVAGGCAQVALAVTFRDDPAKAEASAKQLCDGGDGHGCYVLGFIYETASTTPRHTQDEVIALYDKGCSGGSAEGCNALAMVHFHGRGGVPKDKAKSIAALQRGCELGDEMCCHQISIVQSK